MDRKAEEEDLSMHTTTELGKLAELHQSGALTDAEFSAAKARVLGE